MLKTPASHRNNGAGAKCGLEHMAATCLKIDVWTGHGRKVPRLKQAGPDTK